MPLDVLVKEATGLSDKYVEMALVYIRFLQDQAEKDRSSEKKQKRNLGVLSDQFVSISDDFDETPDCFEDYL